MSTESLAELQSRARVHAALADPARLRMVDHLTAGDASPSELRSLLDMTSNLLAHHVRVLEDAGLVRRRRSEGDRRRSYLQLQPSVFDDLTPHPTRGARRVVFVCTANSARSQLAAALWSSASVVPATSAGTHPARAIAAGATRAARKHHLTLVQEAPQLLADVTEADDLLIAVCDNAYESLPTGATDLHWSIPDPVRVGTVEAFDSAYADLAHRISHLAPRVTPIRRSTT